MEYANANLSNWKAAEREARMVEREVRALLIERAKGDSFGDVEQKIAQAAALRTVAHALLEVVLKDAEMAAQALHYRNVTTPTIQPFESGVARWADVGDPCAPADRGSTGPVSAKAGNDGRS